MLLFVLCVVSFHYTMAIKGVLPLDSVTFDKIIGSTQQYNVLVKFDKEYAYGPKEDAFKTFAETTINSPNFILAQVGVQEHGDKLNEDLRERFAVNSADFPVFKLFKRGESKSITMPGDVSIENLSSFVKNELNLWIGLPGKIEAFDNLALAFAASPSTDIMESASKLVVTVDAKDSENAKFYVLAMKKILEQGEAWVGTETARVTKLLESKITSEKKEQLKQRLNILPSFKKIVKTEL